ncbi:nickel-responsive transcriptional regulator NikR [uncultured Methylobacterium sp.]|uniref:nickel-responsive transcriptional regulator NikR n=1 Tax=uncultured Methylobacterium sp. TaxID=157278 RepID=UPI0035CC7829
MQRITITIDDALLAAVDRLCERRGYDSRSEAVRDIVRGALAPDHAAEAGLAPCYGALSYVYSHGTRDLARRLTDEGHHHGVSVASLHVHLSRDDCLEVAVLRGSVPAMRSFADTVTTQRGVRYGHLHLIPEGDEADRHGHAGAVPEPGGADAAPGQQGSL